MTVLNDDGLVISAQNLSAITPGPDDDGRLFNHDGSSSITLVDSSTTSTAGFYQWSDSDGAWRPLKYTGPQSDYVNISGDTMSGVLSMDGNNIDELTTLQSLTGNALVLSSDTKVSAWVGGAKIYEALGTGNFNVPNGVISQQGNNVATESWVNSNADVPNADYADSAGDSSTLGGKSEGSLNVDKVDGYDIQKNGTDGAGIINFKT